MGAALDMAFDSMPDYFDLPEKRVPLNFRVPTSLKEQLQGVMKAWKWMAEARGRDPKDVDLTFVCERLLRGGLDAAWAQMGQSADLDGMPKTEEEWARLRKTIFKAAKDEGRSK